MVAESNFKYVGVIRIANAFVFGGGAAILLIATYPNTHQTLEFSAWLALLVALVVLVARSLRVGVTVGSDFVTVRNILRTWKIGLDEIWVVNWIPRYGANQLSLTLRDSRIVRPYAPRMKGPKDAGLDVAYAIQTRLAELNGGPFPQSPEEIMRDGLEAIRRSKLPPPPDGCDRSRP